MEGLLVEIRNGDSYDIVDTRNNKYGRLRMYYNKLKKVIPLKSTVKFELKTSKEGNHYAKFISIVERNQVIFNTEDRQKWYEWGEEAESDFIAKIVPQIGDDIRINPNKDRCAWAIDLYNYTLNRPADLKTQNTPFFTASKYKYKGTTCDPTYSITFNRKDYNNYKAHYSDCDIYFWIHWKQLKYENKVVEEIYGVWMGNFSKMAECIESGSAPLHIYKHRRDDDYNSKDSYIFNLLDKEVFKQII